MVVAVNTENGVLTSRDKTFDVIPMCAKIMMALADHEIHDEHTISLLTRGHIHASNETLRRYIFMIREQLGSDAVVTVNRGGYRLKDNLIFVEVIKI